MHGCWGYAWLPGGVHGCQWGVNGCQGACVVARGHAWLPRVCVVARGMHGCQGACMAKGVHGKGGHVR